MGWIGSEVLGGWMGWVEGTVFSVFMQGRDGKWVALGFMNGGGLKLCTCIQIMRVCFLPIRQGCREHKVSKCLDREIRPYPPCVHEQPATLSSHLEVLDA